MASYWYKKIIYRCPFCGYGYVRRVRVYGKKPKDQKERVEHVDVYDFCWKGMKREDERLSDDNWWSRLLLG